jgi:formate dehydrogenase major subunit
LAVELKRLYAAGGTFPDPIVNLNWETGDSGQPDPHVVAREINGRFLADVEFKKGSGTVVRSTLRAVPATVPDPFLNHAAELDKRFASGDLMPSFGLLRDDGSTACGNWLYSGSYTAAGNKMARRRTADPNDDPLGLNPGWAWAWPANRRVLYNRAGCDTKGQPWAKGKAVVTFDWRTGRWTGDVPDGGWPPPKTPQGEPHPAGKHAFIMLDEGRARLFAPGLADGPFPEHYEPLESPAVNPFSPQQVNPMAGWCPEGLLGASDEYPIVATTCRVSEHWLSGPMSRNLPWLVELVPNAFAEMSPRLAAEKGISNGNLVNIRSARGQITVYALVTGRLGPLKLGEKTIEQVAIVWHFGYQGLATGDSANILTLSAGDADTMIPEYKAFLCDVEKAPRV